MSHRIRELTEFINEDYTFRVDTDGSLVTDELLLVEPEDMQKFIEWMKAQYNALQEKETK